MDNEPQDKGQILKRINETIHELDDLGGWEAIQSGEWLFNLIQRTFWAYYSNANADFFREKYPKATDDEIIDKLTNVAAINAGLLGVATGASFSANEISGIIMGAATGGLSVPVQISIAGSFLAAEAILLVRLQLQLVANIAKLHGTPLNLDDPEDIIVVLGLAIGGVGAEGIGKFGAKAAGHATKQFIRKKISGATLEAIKKIGNRVGIKILQKSITKYAVPVVSMVIGGGWNYSATHAVGKVSRHHFSVTKEDRYAPSMSGGGNTLGTKHDGVLRLRISSKLFDLITEGSRKELRLEKTVQSSEKLRDYQFYEARLRSGKRPLMRTMRIECRKVSVEEMDGKLHYRIVLGRMIDVDPPP